MSYSKNAYNRLNLLSLAACLALAGCAATPRTIIVPCIAKDQALPAEPPKIAERLTGRADEDLPIIAGSAVRLRAWGRALNGIVESCR